MIRAAGCMFLTTDGLTLFLKRGNGGDRPGDWCFPGGRLEDEETTAEAAIRETDEESGRKVKAKELIAHTRSVSPIAAPAEMPAGETAPALPEPVAPAVADPETVDFTTYAVRIDAPFIPTLNEEHTGWAWAKIDAPPEPLHPGCRVALNRLGWNELDIARAIASGELTSPQTYHNVTLFAIRITGTGASYRSSLGEYVWRHPEQYLNQDFLDRCNGLQVIWEHPEKATLNSKEFGKRTVGSIFVPFIPGPEFIAANPKARPDDVWGVAKLYDDETIAYLSDPENDASTSPTIVFREPGGGTKLTTEDGKTILVEGTPGLLDHVCICALGVWDKGEGPKGVAAVFADAEPRPLLDPQKLRAAELALTNLNLQLGRAARKEMIS